MSVLRDLAVDVINTAKSSKDSKSKVFQLEQLREIILYRDPELVTDFIGDVFDFTTEKSSVFRKFLIRFSTELFELNATAALPYLIDLYNFYLSDSNDSVLASLSREISKIYPRIVLTLCNFTGQQDSRKLWQSFKVVVTKLTDYVASARSEAIKIFGLHLMEAMLLFGISNTTTTTDPRLARKINDPRLRRGGGAAQADAATSSSSGAAGATNNTADEIPLHHAFMSKTTIQSEAAELFSKLSLWATKGGPQNFPFSPRLMSILGQTLASVGTLRPNQGLNAAKALIVLLSGKSGSANLLQEMSALEKEQLARASTRLQRAITVLAAHDTEDTAGKLKASVNSLELTSTAETTAADAVTGKKRDYTEFIDEEDSEFASEAHALSVKSALQTLESNKRQLQARSLAMSDNIFSTGNLGGMSTGKATGGGLDPRLMHTAGQGEVTELSAELVALQNLSLNSTTKLVTVESGGGANQGETILVPQTAFDGREYTDLAHFNLLRVMENFTTVRETKQKAFKACSELLLRTVLSLSLSSLQAGSMPFMVVVVNTWGADAPADHVSQVPASVLLPRALWLFVSFAFQLSTPIFATSTHQQQQLHGQTDGADAEQTRKVAVQLLSRLCQKLYAAIDLLSVANEGDDSNEALVAELRKVYDSLLIVALSRFLQIVAYRGDVQKWLFSLPYLPPSCLELAIVLARSGSKAIAVHSAAQQQQQQSVARSLRYDALSLIGSLVFASDARTSQSALHYLLWQSLSDDFKFRAKIVDLIVIEVFHQDENVDHEILTFVLQALVFLLGRDHIAHCLQPPPAILHETHDDTRMDSESQPFESSPIHYSLSNVLLDYDSASERFQGDFAHHFFSIGESSGSDGVDDDAAMRMVPDPAKLQENFTKAVHLLEKLAVLEPQLLLVLAEVQCLAALSSTASVETSATTAVVVEASEPATVGDDKEGTASSSAAKGEPWQVGTLMRSKLKVIIADLLGRLGVTSTSSARHAAKKQAVKDTNGGVTVVNSVAEIFNIVAGIAGRLRTPAHSVGEGQQESLIILERSVLLHVVQSLVPHVDQPPRPDLIYAVMDYLQLLPLAETFVASMIAASSSGTSASEGAQKKTLRRSEGDAMDVDGDDYQEDEEDDEEYAGHEEKKVADATAQIAGKYDITTLEGQASFLASLDINGMDHSSCVLLGQLLGAFSQPIISRFLPRLVQIYTSTTADIAILLATNSTSASSGNDVLTQLRLLFQRFTKPIPPPLTRSQLFVHLLQVDVDAYQIDRKALLAILDLCLNNKAEFTAKVVREALEACLPPVPEANTAPPSTPLSSFASATAVSTSDAPVVSLPFAIMRVAILAAKNYPEIIGSFVLHTMIPRLVRAHVWVSAPKVWDGVVMAAKLLAGPVNVTKDTELTLKALLSLPYPQLVAVVKLAANLNGPMSRVLQGLSTEERAQLVSSSSDAVTATATTGNSSAIQAKAERDKERLFKDLMDGKYTVVAPAAAGKK